MLRRQANQQPRREITLSVSSRALGILADQISSLLGDHDSGGICVATHHGRHDRCIDHSQATDTPHAQLSINHSHRITLRSHLAGSNRVILGVSAVANIPLQANGIVEPCRVQHLAADVIEGFGFQ